MTVRPSSGRGVSGRTRTVLRRLGRAVVRYLEDGHAWIWAFGPLGVPPGLAVRVIQRRAHDGRTFARR